MKDYVKKMTSTKEGAEKLLHDAGIINETGQLAEPYRS